MPYADIRGPAIAGNPLFVFPLRRSAVVYLLCFTANLSAWRQFNFLSTVMYEGGRATYSCAVPLLLKHGRARGHLFMSVNFLIPTSALVWPCGGAVQRATSHGL